MTVLDWKRTLYALLALPFGLAGAHERLAARLLGRPPREGTPRYLAAAGVSVAAIPLSLLVWFLVWRIATYGLFWDPTTAGESWGGPSLAGAWFVHFFCALGMTVVAMWLLRPLTDLQSRLLSGRAGAGTGVPTT
ncbi:hypothetical protein [Amycolatopsis sp. FDAARGOS 1241]|uniref:hypothetical protein n=1 Tax=Amycolatopsis sp. FDAARGOS 1241 TaxID=2778070 RepID=UPI001EF212CC|nr:hypothetical protein [Amycolatopsis sp. FDAARGOS 1241]